MPPLDEKNEGLTDENKHLIKKESDQHETNSTESTNSNTSKKEVKLNEPTTAIDFPPTPPAKPLTGEPINFFKRDNFILFICSLTEAIFVFSYFSLIQILPLEVSSLGIQDWMFGLIQGSVGIVAIGSSFFYIDLSKLFQQRTFQIFSILMTGVCDLLIACYMYYGLTDWNLFWFLLGIHTIMGFIRFTSFTAGNTIVTALIMDKQYFKRKLALYKSSTHLSALLGICTIAYYSYIGFFWTMMIPVFISLILVGFTMYCLPGDKDLEKLGRIRDAEKSTKSHGFGFLKKPKTLSLLAVLLCCHCLLRYGVAGSTLYFDQYYPDVEYWLYAIIMVLSAIPSLVGSFYTDYFKWDLRISILIFSCLLPGIGCYFAYPFFCEVNMYTTITWFVCMWLAITFVNVLITADLLKYLSELYPKMPQFQKSKLASNATVTLIFFSLFIGPYLYTLATLVSSYEEFLWYFGLAFFGIGVWFMMTNDYILKLESNGPYPRKSVVQIERQQQQN